LHSQIDLLRHGDVIGGSCYRGITDDPLSPLGWKQMQQALIDQPPWNIILSSPLLRCYAFSQSLAKDLHCPLISVDAFQEINFGDWEGKTADQINPIQLSKYYADPSRYPPPNGESFQPFQERVTQAWQNILTQYPDKKILLITHAGVIRVILAQVLGLDLAHSFKIKIAHACFSRIDCFYDAKSGDFLQLTQHGR